jgi:hypothetical protein
MGFEIDHVEMLPSGHGIYKAKVQTVEGHKITIVITDMELVDEWFHGDREVVYDYIKTRLYF